MLNSKNLRVLVPVDLRDAAFNALRYASDLASVKEIHVLYIMEEGFANRGLAMYPKHLSNVKHELRKKLKNMQLDHKVTNIEVIYDPQGPVGSIERYSSQNDIDLVVMANANRKIFFKAIFGNTTLGVIKRDFVNVLVVPEGATHDQHRKVVIAVDAEHADQVDTNFVGQFGTAKITIAHIGPKDQEDWMKTQALISEALFDESNPKQTIEVTKSEGDEVATGIMKVADRENADLIVFFINQQSIISRLFFSSTTKEVLQSAKLPLYFVKS